jgi:DNA primase catalytic core
VDKLTLAKEIKSRLPLSSVVKSAVNLRGRGHSLIGLCPFHEEKTPSFHVRDNVARYKCFGCGASGDVIEFVMRLRGIAFNEAVSELAERAGLGIPRPHNPVSDDNVLLRAQKIAQEYFCEQLTTTAGQKAFDYLVKERGLSAKMIKQAGLGFGGEKNDGLGRFLESKGISEPQAIKAGLLKRSEYGLRQPFFKRLTVPIRNMEGHIIAFGGRALDEQNAKYVNTHSYVHYEKRRHFYGLYESKAAILKGVAPILVEGYFDAMAIWALGMPALALCGTALTNEHVTILKSLAAKVTICFDRDGAGLLGLRRALMELFAKDMQANVIVLDEKDAGVYLARNTMNHLDSLLKKPVDALCFLIENAAIEAKANISDRVKQMDDLLEIFAHIKRPLVRRQYVAYLAKNLHEDPGLLWTEVDKRSRRKKIVLEKQKQEQMRLSPTERLSLEIIMADCSLISDMDEVLKECHEEFAAIVRNIYEQNKSVNESRNKAAISEIFAGKITGIDEIIENSALLSPEQANDCLVALKAQVTRRNQKGELKKKREEMQQFERKGDFLSVLKNLKEQSVLLEQSKRPCLSEPSAFDNLAPALLNEKTDTNGFKKEPNIHSLEKASMFEDSDDWL